VGAIEMKDSMVVEIDIERCLGCGVCTSICSPEALRLEKRDPDRILTPVDSADELLIMRGTAKGKPYPVHPH
jgi:Fe-S-cluster-containing hydrogenase component 2